MIKEEVNAKKETLTEEDAWQLVAGADQIFVASGKKTLVYKPTPANKAEILKKILGRTGNLRAPAMRRANTFYIGYNDDLYQQITAS